LQEYSYEGTVDIKLYLYMSLFRSKYKYKVANQHILDPW
jgi:hypothetical protein